MKWEILTEFEGTDQGYPRLLLGIEIHWDRSACTITITQGQYIRKILRRFTMSKFTPRVYTGRPFHSSQSGKRE